MENLKTVKEYATERKLSTQAVYKQISNGTLKTKTVNNKRYIVIDDETAETPKDDTSALIEMLQRELDTKNAQIRELNDRLKESNILNSQVNTLLLQANEKIKLLEMPKDEQMQETPPKKTFSQKLKDLFKN